MPLGVRKLIRIPYCAADSPPRVGFRISWQEGPQGATFSRFKAPRTPVMNYGVYPHRHNQTATWTVGFALLVAVGVADWLTGPDLSLSLLYLVPTAAVAWRGGRLPALFAGAASTLVWLGIELNWRRHYASPWVPYHNCALQLTVTEFTAVLTAALSMQTGKLQREIRHRIQAEENLAAANELLENRVAERSAAAERRASDLRISEAALRRQSSLLGSILACMADGVVVADLAGAVRLFNPAAARIFSINPDGAGVSAWSDQCPWSLTALLASVSQAGEIQSDLKVTEIDGHELRVLAADGMVSWFAVTARPLVDEVGEAQGVIWVLRDTTSRKETDRLVVNASERERQRIGQDVHDGLGQQLFGAAIAVNLLRQRLSQRDSPEVAEADEIAGLLDDAITQTRDLARGLYPVMLEEGLPAALKELADSVRRTAGLDCRFESGGAVRIFDPDVAANLYRIAQEAVNNALKHAGATRIIIGLEGSSSVVRLTVANDGRSFEPPGPENRGIGLQIMQYRARTIGADLRMTPGKTGGSIIRCAAPNPSVLLPIYGSSA